MTETILTALGVLVIIGATMAAVAVPDFIDATLARLRGRGRACADCGDKLTAGDGATCVTCRDIRRQRLARGQTRTAREAPEGDNGP